MTLALGVAGPVALIGTSSNLLIAGIAAPAGIDMTMLSLAPVVLGAIVVESELAKVLADAIRYLAEGSIILLVTNAAAASILTPLVARSLVTVVVVSYLLLHLQLRF